MVCREFNLSGKIALVAGDNTLWSKHVATALAAAGADVAVAARSPALLEMVSEVERLERKATAIPTDVTKAPEVQKMVDRTIAEFGKIDIMVNTTDLKFTKPFLEIREDEWRKVMAANLDSIFLCWKAVGRHMLNQKKGRLITIASCLAERGLLHKTAYCAAMGGVLQLTRALALEWAREGITVNAIGAGWFSDTDKTGVPQEDQLLHFLPLRRYGHPSEIGSLVVYLASDAADFLTGQLFCVDGAVMAHP